MNLKKITIMKIETIIANLLSENTGVHMLDSGGDNNRAWQRNQGKDFEKEDSVTLEDGYFTVSLYHYLKETLSVDTCYDGTTLCDESGETVDYDLETVEYSLSLSIPE